VDDAGARPIRSFVALELGGAVREALVHCLDELRATGAAVAWVRPANLHVTLRFLGAASPVGLVALRTRLAPVAAAQAPFPIVVRGCGAFPTLRRPRALWVGVQAPPLAALAAAVEAACAAAGFPPEEGRVFRPHVTLGRVRGARRPAADPGTHAALDRLEALRDADFGVSPAEHLTLFRSDLGPGGARYTPLASWRFGVPRIDG
jgi:2'-5' RNA ligase